MFCKKILSILIVTIFFFGCEKTKEKRTERMDESQSEHDGDTGKDLIILNHKAIEIAGIKTLPVGLRNLSIEFTFSGKVSFNETKRAYVGSRISGRAVVVYANPGNLIKKGEALALIDSFELGEAQSQYLKAKTSYELAEKSYARAKIILEGKVISEGEFQKRESDYLFAKAELKISEDKLHLLGMTENEILSIRKEHTINSKVSVYAPISGTVIEKHLTLGEIIEPTKPLFTIADLSNLWIIADVPENDITKVKMGMSVSITLSPYPEKIFNGKINYIAETIDPETRTVKARAVVENRDKLLKPEMFASVRVKSLEKKRLLAIPESAVEREKERAFVFVEKNKTSFEKRIVEIGPLIEGYHHILSGLNKGERIVVKGGFTLKSETMKEMMEEE